MTSRTEDASAPPSLTRELHTAENDLAKERAQLREIADFIHDPAYDFAARRSLAKRLDLPGPGPAPTTASGTQAP
ncbi:hypothetical protein ACWDBO_30065 [Streptomyces mirabilis]|uniref:hypothetical protein n=1 Tax=Streptomyces mirabilis TaxID=68239 RepID=UPI0033211D33